MRRRIRHTCGHEVTHDVRGKAEERDRRFRWLSRTVCTDCWKSNRQLEAELDTAIHALPPLSGSPGQVTWAERIRAGRVRQVYELWFDARIAARATDPLTEELTMSQALEQLARPTWAGWWIDHKDEDVSALLKLLGSAVAGL